MGVRANRCQSSDKSFLKWNLSPNADKKKVHKSCVAHYHTHTKTICQIMLKCAAAYFNSSECEWGYLVLTDTNTGGVSPPRYVCALRAKSLCKNIFRLEAHCTPKIHATSTTVHFLFREREQYVHCAAGICNDRTAAGSEVQKRAEREDSFIIHGVF